MKLLEVEDLSVDMAAKGRSRRILHQVNLSLEPGRIVGLMGESGAGKTVLASTLCGLLTPPVWVSEGRIAICGKTIPGNDKRAWRAVRGRQIMMMFQSAASALNPYMKIGKQIAEAIEEIHRVPYKKAFYRALELLEQVGLETQVADGYPFQLSGGMQQRILIAIAIGLHPKILVADEPTTGLDPTTKLNILKMIQSLNQEHKMAILFISHDVKAVAFMTDTLSTLHDGRLIETGAFTEMFKTPQTPYMRKTVASLRELDAASRCYTSKWADEQIIVG